MPYGNPEKLGAGIDPRMFVQDYSGFADAAKIQAAGLLNFGNQVGGAVADYAKEQKELQADIAKGKTSLAHFKTLNPELADKIDELGFVFKDPTKSKVEQAAAGRTMSDDVASFISSQRYGKEFAMKERELGMREEEFQQRYGATQMEIERQKVAAADDSKNKAVIGPVLFEHTLKMLESASPAAAAEIRKNSADATASQKFSLTNSMMGLIPKSERAKAPSVQDIPTGDGGSLKMQWSEEQGQWVPMQTSIQNSGGTLAQEALPVALQPYATAFNSAGAKHGVDPRVLAAISMHETGNGTSNAFRNKNNAMGISNNSGPVDTGTVEASIDKMAALLAAGQQGKGPYAGKSTIDQIAGTYAPVGAQNDPRGLNSSWTGGVSKNLQQLGGDPAATIGYTPPPNATPSPTEQIAVAKYQDEKAANEAKAVTGVAEAEGFKDTLKELAIHPGFTNLFGSNIGVPTWMPGSSGADAKAILGKVQGKAFLEAIQKMKGMGALSEKEGETATKAYSALTPSMSEFAALKEIKSLQDQLDIGIQRQKSGQLVNPDGTPKLATAQAPTDPVKAATTKLQGLLPSR